jgi:hypothetical protein
MTLGSLLLSHLYMLTLDKTEDLYQYVASCEKVRDSLRLFRCLDSLNSTYLDCRGTYLNRWDLSVILHEVAPLRSLPPLFFFF